MTPAAKGPLNEFFFISFKEHISRYIKAEYIPQECEDYESAFDAVTLIQIP